MMETFEEGADIHTATAQKIYGIDEVTADDVERFARLYLTDTGRSVVKLSTKESQK